MSGFKIGDRVEITFRGSELPPKFNCKLGDKATVVNVDLLNNVITVVMDDRNKGSHYDFPGSLKVKSVFFKKVEDLTSIDNPTLKAIL